MFFDAVPLGPPDPIFGLADAFRKDPRKEKITLVLGIYNDEHLETNLIPAVNQAKKRIFDQESVADYLPIGGNAIFVEKIANLLFGEGLSREIRDRVAAVQSVGGTGALRLGAEFFFSFVGKTIWIPDPTWVNHRHLFEKVGCVVKSYPYYCKKTRRFDVSSMLSCLRKAEKNSAVLLHGVCHNPSGCDPSEREWQEIADVMQERRLLPFFDIAYQGFGEGLDLDAQAIRLFVQKGLDCMIGYSCSKNFSLYCQRVGAFFLVTKDSEQKRSVESQMKRFIRALYSNPPSHGARIVQEVLSDEILKKEWAFELTQMRGRLSTMRNKLVALLQEITKEDQSYLLSHKGMFSFIDLKERQVQRLIQEFAIYLPKSGRVNVAGLNDENLPRVAESIAAVILD